MTDIAAERRLLAAQGLDIGYREEWGAAQDYRSNRRVDTPAAGFFLHISVTIDHGDLTGNEHADMRAIERVGQQRFGDPYDQQLGFPYNAAVFDTGRLYEGQPLTRRGAHTVNDKGIAKYGATGASLNYGYRALVLPQMVTDDVTDAQVDAAARWAAAQARAGLARRGARWDLHRTVAWKACPGDTAAARLDELNRLTAHYEANGLGPAATPTPVPLEEDDVFTIQTHGQPVRLVIGGVAIGFDDIATRDRVLTAFRRAGVLTTKPVVFDRAADHDMVLAKLVTQGDLDAILRAASTTQLGEAMVDIDAIRKNLGTGTGNVLRAPLVDVVREALRQAGDAT